MNVRILKLWPNEHKNVAGTSGGELKKCWTLELWPGKNNVQWADKKWCRYTTRICAAQGSLILTNCSSIHDLFHILTDALTPNLPLCKDRIFSCENSSYSKMHSLPLLNICQFNGSELVETTDISTSRKLNQCV